MRKNILLFTSVRNLSDLRTICHGWEAIRIDWKSWESREQLGHYPCWRIAIPYLKIREPLKEERIGEACFVMDDPMQLLLDKLETWYLLGAEKRTFAFYRAFRQKVDELGLESDISIRVLADWLLRQNVRPLFDPQIGTIDPAKRFKKVQSILKREFRHRRICTECDTAKSQGDSGKKMILSRIDVIGHRRYFEPFFLKDQKLYDVLESGALDARKKHVSKTKKEAQGKKQKSRKTETIKARVMRVTPKRIIGWISAEMIPGNRPSFLILEVNGKKVLRQKVTPDQGTEQRKQQQKIRFLLEKLTLRPSDEVKLYLNPGRKRILFSPQAKRFFESVSDQKSVNKIRNRRKLGSSE